MAVWGSNKRVVLARVTAVLCAVVLLAGVIAASREGEPGATARTAAPTTVPFRPMPPPTTAPPETLPPTTEAPTTTTSAPPETAPPSTEAPSTTEPPAVAATGPLPAAGTWTEDPYRGLGAWVDVYDWSEAYGGSAVGVGDVDRMA